MRRSWRTTGGGGSSGGVSLMLPSPSFMRPVKSRSTFPSRQGAFSCTSQRPEPTRTLQLAEYAIVASPPDFTITRPPGGSSLELVIGSKPSPMLTSTAPPSFDTVAALKGLTAMAVERSPASNSLHGFGSIGPFPHSELSANYQPSLSNGKAAPSTQMRLRRLRGQSATIRG